MSALCDLAKCLIKVMDEKIRYDYVERTAESSVDLAGLSHVVHVMPL